MYKRIVPMSALLHKGLCIVEGFTEIADLSIKKSEI